VDNLLLFMALIGMALFLFRNRRLFAFAPALSSSSGLLCLSPGENEKPSDLSGGSFYGIFGSIGKIIGGVVGVASKVGAVIPGVGPVVSAAAGAVHSLVWPGQAEQLTVQPAQTAQTAPVLKAASPGLLGLSTNTLLFVGGGIALFYFMSKRRR